MGLMQAMMGNLLDGLHSSSSNSNSNPFAAMMAQFMPYQRPSDIPTAQLANPVSEEEFNKAKQGK